MTGPFAAKRVAADALLLCFSAFFADLGYQGVTALFPLYVVLTLKISIGMRATINEALLLGDSVGRPLGLLNPKAGIPICETSANTPAGQFTWVDVVMLK